MHRPQGKRRHRQNLLTAALTVGLAASVTAPGGADPIRIGTRDHVDHLQLEVHAGTGNLFAVFSYEEAGTYGWEVHLSTDGGVTWARTRYREATTRTELLSAAVVGDHLYFVAAETGAASGQVRVFRTHATTGITDAVFGTHTVVDVGLGNLEDLVLFSNADGSNSHLYLALIEGDGDLRFFYALTALFDIGGATPSDWNELGAGTGGTGVTNASWRLDGAFNAGTSPYVIFLSYIDTAGWLCVWRLAQTGHDATALTADATSNDHIRIAADRNAVIVVYTRQVAGMNDVLFHYSPNAGSGWGWSTLALHGASTSFGAATISARWHRGFMAGFHRQGGGDAFVSSRRPAEENRWGSAPALVLPLRTGTRSDIQPLVGGGWGALFVGDDLAAYFLLLPLQFADGFASGDVALWSSAVGG